MSLEDVLAMPGCTAADTLISGIELDSRKISAGDLFLAVPGEAHDGRQFIEQAVASGAVAVVAEPPVSGFVDALSVPLLELPELQQESGYLASRFCGTPSAAMHMIGVTGTNGKTTTSRLIAQLIRQRGRSCGVIGTLGATLEEEVSQGGNTTPDAVTLQQQLARWRDQGVYAVSMEVSSHALVQGRVNGVEFETAVFTNLSHDHLDYHGSMEAYGRAKLGLFTCEGLRHALVNLDDDFASCVQAVVEPGVRILSYSLVNPAADVFVEQAEFGADGVRGILRTPWGSGAFFSPLPGDFNLANLAAAVCAAVLAGEGLEDVLAAVPALRPVPGRMQSIPNDHGLQVIIDYAHTPDALEQVLSALKPHVQGELAVVFGCGGDRDRNKRQLMGRIACGLADRVVLTSDNPRGEDPLAILADIESGCSGNYRLQADRAEAIALAVQEARPGDCIVIAGKGHEDYQIVEGDYLRFSDEEHAVAALAGRSVL
ncbi:UDP-N-acetylmuramoyl-L-alanyl-D-glutamate--2,6-diaminopimelate ligase [Pseudohalioglobus lutimaris]|uniref:UDP-N-acetylmuramoyl-L-alanyl-D-glutamate--2,6-diaminopimelate ligase n=1 Tax=Pseudohalioglobus lutimaris TaxID=1737061 RepID=A0A2N5X7Q1_9GAMM|nr:UDP-N-acetylmuramoyl-L-alanyl-D-glutamate--2,6-diaminopimelate ligase [Pseudohalioglobus lutimaris]PLW70510.1 UDP-N-acetylmuramoyl-L-alanyl-D-glutamate--2,6-diaminopimelate ligase [Pseudohalioglobus lutimaris]